ncbi:MAG TPA: hypothetical protein VGH24_08660, partial [Solirubrobacteraceae bacterium]
GLNTLSSLGSTVPGNGDINPYGIVTVPRTIGNLVAGDLLISNFNASSNLQGTCTTIVEMTPSGSLRLFARIDPGSLHGACPGGVGLTTALAVLRTGFVVVGSLPTADGTSATAKAGCLLVINRFGHVVETFSGGLIDGPWDMTALDDGSRAVLFVTNVLRGTVAANGNVNHDGTVVRIDLRIPADGIPVRTSTTLIGRGFAQRTDPAALVIGPTGVAFEDGELYVADTLNSRIARIPHAFTRTTAVRGGGITVSSGGALNGPLGLAIAPGGDILSTNGADGNLVETTRGGTQVATKTLDPAGAGVLFGLVVGGPGVYFVDDGDNTLRLLS